MMSVSVMLRWVGMVVVLLRVLRVLLLQLL